jgi:hypothetical protein
MAESERQPCPEWVDRFTDLVGGTFRTDRAPMAFDVWGPDEPGKPESPDDPWEVHFYPSLGEVIGGPDDGAITYPPMKADVLKLQRAFDAIDEVSVSNLAEHQAPRYDGTVLDLIGEFERHPIRLRIFDAPPDDASIDAVIDHKTGKYRPKAPPDRPGP